jgi:hypothetical protein
MTILQVVNLTWFIRQVSSFVREFWSALPVEITATAEAHPARALITLGVLMLVVARVAMVSGGSVTLIAARVLLPAAGLLLLLELEISAVSMAVFSTMDSQSRSVAEEL